MTAVDPRPGPAGGHRAGRRRRRPAPHPRVRASGSAWRCCGSACSCSSRSPRSSSPPPTGGWSGVLGHGHQRADRGRHPAHRRHRARWSPLVNVVMGTLIAWVLVRDRFFGKRALEVLIDIPFALPTIVAGLVLLSLYGPDSPLGVDVANTRVGGVPGVPVRHAAVRRAHGAAGARRARPRGRGGGGVAGRQPVHHVPPDHPAQPDAGHRRRRRPVVRPRRSASTARWCCCRATCRCGPRSPRCGSSAASRTTTWTAPPRSPRSCWSISLAVIVAARRHPAAGGPPWLSARPRRAPAGRPHADRSRYVFRLRRHRATCSCWWPGRVSLVVKNTFADGLADLRAHPRATRTPCTPCGSPCRSPSSPWSSTPCSASASRSCWCATSSPASGC